MPDYNLRIGGKSFRVASTDEPISHAVGKRLAGKTPQTQVDSAGNARSYEFGGQELTFDDLRDIKQMRESGGQVAQLMQYKALLNFGEGAEFHVEDNDETEQLVDGDPMTLEEWLETEAFPHIDLLTLDLGEDALWYPAAVGEIRENQVGGFSEFLPAEPWTLLPETNKHGEITAWHQETQQQGGRVTQVLPPEEIVNIILNRQSARDKTGISEVLRNKDEIQAFKENEQAINQAIELHGFPQRHVKVGKEGGAPLRDNDLRRVRSIFDPRTTDANTAYFTGQDVDVDTLEAQNFDYTAVHEMDMRNLTTALGLPLEAGNVGSDGLGSGKPAELRFSMLKLAIKANQRSFSQQFVKKVVTPVVRDYSPFDHSATVRMEIDDPLEDIGEVADLINSVGDYMTNAEARRKLDLAEPEDDEVAEAYRSPADIERAEEGDGGGQVDNPFGGVLNSKELSEIPDNAVSISDKSEAPEGAQVIKGDEGGLYYVPNGAGESNIEDQVSVDDVTDVDDNPPEPNEIPSDIVDTEEIGFKVPKERLRGSDYLNVGVVAWDMDDSEAVDVDPSVLQFNEPSLDGENIKDILDADPDDLPPIEGYQTESGDIVVTDGNHRAAAAKIAGWDNLDMKLVNLSEFDDISLSLRAAGDTDFNHRHPDPHDSRALADIPEKFTDGTGLSEDDFVPNESILDVVEPTMEFIDEHGLPNPDDQQEGAARINQLHDHIVNNEPLAADFWQEIRAFHDRHRAQGNDECDESDLPEKATEIDNSQFDKCHFDNGWFSNRTWGGDPAYEQAQRVVGAIEDTEGVELSAPSVPRHFRAPERDTDFRHRCLAGVTDADLSNAPDFDRPLLEMYQGVTDPEAATDRTLVSFASSATPEFVLERIREAIRDGAMFTDFDDIPSDRLFDLREEMADSLTADGGFTLDSVTDSLMDFSDALDRDEAERIARTESSAVLNKAREIGYESEEAADRRFYWTGAEPGDSRQTEACEWLIRQTNPNYGGDPVLMDELRDMVAEAPEHDDDMPDNMARPDSWTVHINERSTFVKAPGT